MFSRTETLSNFLLTAISALLAKRDDDLTWAKSEATTTAALETVYEFLAGPEPYCRYSYTRHQIDNLADNERLRFSLHGMRQTEYWRALESHGIWSIDHTLDYPASDLRRQRLGQYDGVRNDEDAWLTVRWERLSGIAHPDVHVQGRFQLRGYPASEAWLHAQIGYVVLHDLYPADIRNNRLTERFMSLLDASGAPPWNSQSISDIETTAIVTQFLFHHCTQHFLRKLPTNKKAFYLSDKTFDWILGLQRSDGSWASSPHITSHCIRAIAEHASAKAEYQAAVEKAMVYLLSPEIVTTWNQFDTYRQIEVLLTIIRVSRLSQFQEFSRNIIVEGGFHQATVFVSYAGCDVDFTKKLARALEDNGIPVWFAEWDIDYGDDIVESIQLGLESTRTFLIVLSPESVSRPWVRKELATAFFQGLSGPGKLIIPLRYKDCDLPSFLRTHKWIDFSQPEQFDSSVQELVRKLKHRRKDRI